MEGLNQMHDRSSLSATHEWHARTELEKIARAHHSPSAGAPGLRGPGSSHSTSAFDTGVLRP